MQSFCILLLRAYEEVIVLDGIHCYMHLLEGELSLMDDLKEVDNIFPSRFQLLDPRQVVL